MKILFECPVCGYTEHQLESPIMKATSTTGGSTIVMFEYRCLRCVKFTKVEVRRWFDSTNPNWLRFNRRWEALVQIPEDGPAVVE
jgi:hypothetical protein